MSIYVCAGCDHYFSDHRLVAGGELVGGPYRCLYCDCETRQDAPTSEISNQAFARIDPKRDRRRPGGRRG